MNKKTAPPLTKGAPPAETDEPANKAVKRTQAAKKKSSRKPRAQSDTKETNASRAEDQQPRNGSFVVVGIGASAGGLEAFKQLLAHLSADTGMAFVLITHLDPTHESILPELLARAIQMPVSEVQDGMAVAPDHVYVIPHNAGMAIEGGALRLRPRQEGRGQHRPIDSFLQTLAEDRNTRAIGVILSGTATDGTLGLEAIKAEGGITFAQEPKSAKYDSMPRSAIAAGCVDFILTPQEIAKELARISRHPYVAPAATAEPDAEETAQPAGKNGFNKILTLLRRTTGVDFSLYKANTLHRRIRRRMILNKLDGLEEYARYLRENSAEVERLYQDILINVTSFFRNPESFEVLKEKILSRLIERRASDEPLRIWALGCSTGEEAYSIAMAFTEIAGERSSHIPVQIFATDINEKSIDRARAGLYSKDITADVSPERLRRFFTEEEGGYRISKPLRDMCVFARQNVAADPPFSRMDLISCRNLMIYLEPALQKQILPLLHYSLKPTGILWLGSSETTGAAPDLFEAEDKRHRFYARKPTTERPRIGHLRGAEARKKDRAPSEVEIVGATATSGEKEAQREADRIILARYAPASALINEELNVLQLRGDTASYLEHSRGKAAGNLLRLARKDLLVALREAVDKARKDGSPVRKENLRVGHNGATNTVNLEVIPLRHHPSQKHHFLALFETTRTADQGPGRKAVGGRRKSEEQRIKQLQQELAAARDYLQSMVEEYEAANEELQSASEEVQSSNEELQSINEELETSKEELESSNEELTTLNEELNNRNTELGRLNSDLVNLLGSIHIPILMLDGQLRIRRFTPAAEKLLNLIRTDVGRSIGDLKLNLDYPDLERLITEVIDTVSVKEREVQDSAGRWHSLRVRPYKTLDNKIDGAVVALVDIDALKRTEQEIEAARDYAEAILRTAPNPLIVLDAGLRVQTVNDAFYKSFKVAPDATEGCLIYDMGNHQWDIPRLRQLLEEIITRNNFFDDYEITHEFQTIGKRIMLLNARRLDNPEGSPERILLGIDDVTERKLAETAMAQMAAIIESSDDAIISTDLNGVIASWNKGAEKLFSYTAEEVTGKPVMILIPPERADEEPQILERIRRGEQIDHYETVRRRKDGSEIDISLTVSPIKDKTGKVIGASKIARDIIERKRAEAQLREEAEVIKTIHRKGRVISAELNLQNLVQEVTATATGLVNARYGAFFYNVIDHSGESYMLYALYGAPREAFANFPLPRNTDLFGPTFRGEGTVRIADVKKDPRYGKTPPYYGMPAGHLPVRSYLAVPVVSRTGEVLGGLFFGHPDEGVFTERHERIVEGLAAQAAIAIDNARLYELSQREREKAEEANRLKDEFLANVSHELRSPLNAILGWAKMLSENRLDEEKSARAVQVIYNNAHAQNQLIGDLLDVSRIITGKLRLEVSEVELIPVIEAAIDVVRPAADAKQISLISALNPAAGLVSGDADRLRQIVWNLLSNAVKFTPMGGQVAVRLERESASVTITVSDTGEGIEPSFLPFVFDRFRQFESRPARAAGGLGLGLAIVRHLVELHGGTVSAASRGRGRGATFTVTLPLAFHHREASKVESDRPPGAGEIPRVSAPPRDRLRDLRVLVVDDEPDARDLLSLLLTSYGAEVKICASAAEALQMLDEWRPDALVSDIAMPDEDGYELMRKIRARETERGGRIPAVALTAYARAEDARQALAAGYQMHVTKPVDSNLLVAAVASLVGRSGDE